MEASRDQNSAAVLSLSHCVLAMHFTDSAKKDADWNKETRRAMIDIYRCMERLRSAIHGIRNDDSDIINIPEIAKHFNSIVSGIPEETWMEVVSSLMGEVVSMKDALDKSKERLSVPVIIKSTTNKDDFIYEVLDGDDNQPKFLTCLLTLWYWLAAWISPDQLPNLTAKDDFIQAVEAHAKTLGLLLVDASPIDRNERQVLQLLFSKLLQMLKSDPHVWTDILSEYNDKMVNAGKLCRQVDDAAALHDGRLGLKKKSSSEASDTVVTCSIGGLFTRIIKGVGPAIAGVVLDKILDTIVDAVKSKKDSVMVASRDISKEANTLIAARKVANDAECFDKTIHDEVKRLAILLGKGLEHLA